MPVSGKRSVLEVPLTALCSVAVEEAGRAAAGAVLAPERQRPACGGAGVARRKSWLSGCRLDECVLPQHDSGYTAQANRSPDDQQKETVEGETPPHWSFTSGAARVAEVYFFWHGDAKPQVRPRACPPPARRRCSSHAFSTTGSNAGTGRPAADPSFIGGRRTKGARQGFGVSFVRSFVCCTCTCTHARVRAHAFAHAKARSADLSSNLPKVAARKSCVQLLPPHMGDTVPLLKPHPIYEGILGTLYAHRRAAATRRTSSHSTPPRTGMPPW